MEKSIQLTKPIFNSLVSVLYRDGYEVEEIAVLLNVNETQITYSLIKTGWISRQAEKRAWLRDNWKFKSKNDYIHEGRVKSVNEKFIYSHSL